jgi:hypothetical protein
MTTEGTLGVVMVWLGVVVVLGNRLAVDVITREDVVDGLAVVVITEEFRISDVGVVVPTEVSCMAGIAAVVVSEKFCVSDIVVFVGVVAEGFCIADNVVGVVTGVANAALFDGATFTEVKVIAEESCDWYSVV